MRFFPILDELFSSDTVIILLIGLVVSGFLGILIKNTKKSLIGLVVCLIIYAISELLSNIRTNNFVEIILLFVGTLAIGGALGFLISVIISMRRRKEEALNGKADS